MSKNIVDSIWHFKVEDNLGWDFCAGILKQNEDIEMTASEVKKIFEGYFKSLVNIRPFAKCPICSKKLIPRKSKYGYFVGCSAFPDCKFTATSSKPYVKQEVK